MSEKCEMEDNTTAQITRVKGIEYNINVDGRVNIAQNWWLERTRERDQVSRSSERTSHISSLGMKINSTKY